MGKLYAAVENPNKNPHCEGTTAPICGEVCCDDETSPDNDTIKEKSLSPNAKEDDGEREKEKETETEEDDDDDVYIKKELLVIGSGPHALSLVLRLLEPTPDFWSDKERHIRANFIRSKMRPMREVYDHIDKLLRGPKATLKKPKVKKKRKNNSDASSSANTSEEEIPPPLSLADVRESAMVVDTGGTWLSNWKQNFEAIGIPYLRSPTSAHADPFDHRTLTYFAERRDRESDLIPFSQLGQRDDYYRGPYDAPNTQIFHDFHDLLVKGYGVADIVQQGTVTSIIPTEDDTDPEGYTFRVFIRQKNESTPFIKVKTKRVVCALGPMFQTDEAFWERSQFPARNPSDQFSEFPSYPILHAHEVVPWLKAIQTERYRNVLPQNVRLLVVGGGITSAQLALMAADPKRSPWCESVMLIQRSKMLCRQFDLENAWMGQQRGKRLDEFHSLPFNQRAKFNKAARGGGSIPPEIITELERQNSTNPRLEDVKEEVQITQVLWVDNRFVVRLDDGSPEEAFDMIWLSTGSDNDIERYSVLESLLKELPIDVVNGLPVLQSDLSWGRTLPSGSSIPDEPEWKQLARKRLWCMGVLASLQLGPDALNLLGARQGAVKVAKAIRSDMASTKGS